MITMVFGILVASLRINGAGVASGLGMGGRDGELAGGERELAGRGGLA
jgi:hypothetical protein